MTALTLPLLKSAAKSFLQTVDEMPIANLYGITDGKKVGTYVEIQFNEYLKLAYTYTPGNSASGIDFPEIGVDLKATSIKQPQSSCPYTSASQKVYGLGYHVLVFVYEKTDEPATRTAKLNFKHAVFVEREQTGDYQTSRGLQEILERDGNKDDIVAFLYDRNLPLDDIGPSDLADRILSQRPAVGYLTISNALQWRLQYGRVIALASRGNTSGVEDLLV